MPGCIVSATTASFISVENRRRRATPVITSTFENVSDIGVCLGLSLGPPAKAGVRSKQGAVQPMFMQGYFDPADVGPHVIGLRASVEPWDHQINTVHYRIGKDTKLVALRGGMTVSGHASLVNPTVEKIRFNRIPYLCIGSNSNWPDCPRTDM